MPILDTDRILNGTDVKKLIHAYEELSHNYTDDAASQYRSNYVGKPLSFIVNNASYIIPEPQFGLPFIQWVATAFPHPHRHLSHIHGCICEYLDKYASRMHPELKASYVEVCKEIAERMKNCPSVCIKPDIVTSDFEDKFFDNCYSELCKKRYHADNDYCKKFFGTEYKPCDGCEDFNEYLRSCPNEMTAAYITPYAKELSCESCLYESFMSLIDTSENSGAAKAKNLIACEMVQNISRTDGFMEAVDVFANTNLKNIVRGMLNADIAGEIISAFESCAEDTINPVYNTTTDAVNAIMEESVFDELYKEERLQSKSELVDMKHAVYESVRNYVQAYYETHDEKDIMPETQFFTLIKESMGIDGEITVEDAFKLINEAVSEIEVENASFFEKVGDGSANKVIQKSHSMFREDDKLNEKVRVSANGTSSYNNEEDDASEKDDDESELPESTRVASKNLPDSSNPNAANSKPKKEKQGVLATVQNKAMDVHKNSRKKAEKLRQVGTGVANAGKAVLKIPAGLLNGMKDLVSKFDEADDNLRKSYMLKTGYRKKVLKNLRVAGEYGLAWHTKKLLIPVVWFGRKLSKEKNKRIRNEFAKELETEIKVTEAKIEDAMQAGDQKQRYQLMRIRDELARQRERVMTNGKYI